MTNKILTLSVLLFAGYANASVQDIFFSCPNGMTVHLTSQAAVYIDTKQVKVKKYNNNYFEVTKNGDTISLSRDSGSQFSASYTGKNGANGVCSVTQAPAKNNDPFPYASSTAKNARPACIAAVAKQLGTGQQGLVVTDIMESEAATVLMVQAPQADAPWKCFTDRKGHVTGVEYSGSEG
ncbi:hypothetical protein ACFOSS_01975 [Pseudaeromonas sharmana]|uniref:Uncharacterized protein n=1 Tax=Pseudaeromonas sharmana TaxID=328412 RepID=A0ABV8CK79_9GAMM